MNVSCEVQIKTMLVDAFGAWTHDLIYKPRGLLPDAARDMTATVGKQLQIAEDTGQAVRDHAEKLHAWEESLRRDYRRLYVGRLIASLGAMPWFAAGLPKKDEQELGRLLRSLGSPHRAAEGRIDRYARWIAERILPTQPRTAAHLMMGMAVAWPDRSDLAESAVDYQNKWVELTREWDLKLRALSYQNNLLFLLHRLPDAVESAQRAFELVDGMFDTAKRADKPRLRAHVVLAAMNLAHHLAELGPHPRSSDLATDLRAIRARSLVTHARSLQRSSLRTHRRDTAGWVQIRFGRTAHEVRAGRDTCEQAYEEWTKEAPHPDDLSYFASFTRYHGEVAAHRLKHEFDGS